MKGQEAARVHHVHATAARKVGDLHREPLDFESDTLYLNYPRGSKALAKDTPGRIAAPNKN